MTNSGAPINGTITATANCPVGATCTFYKWIGGVGFGAAGNPAYLTLQDFQQGPSYSAYYAVTPGVNTPKDVYTIDIKASFTPAAGCFTNNAATRVYLNTDFGTRDAQCSSVNAPDRVSPGQSFSATITMLNTGAASWINRDLGSGIYDLYRLGGFNPANGAIDVTIWGVGRWGANSYPITAGTIGTFSGNFTAPAAIATYPFYWKMVNDKSYPNMGGGAWFGGYCGKNITVQPVPAPTVTLSVNTAFGSVSNGGSIYTHGYNDVPTLTWSSTDTTSCTLTSNNGDSKTGTSDTNVAANGLGNDSGSGRTITYTLNCAGPSGNASASANVLIPPAPTAPNAVCPSPGTAATLSWTAPAGYTNFYVRNDDVTSGMPANSHAYWNENFAGTRYDIPNAYPGYAYPVNPIPNHNYSMWIHSRAPNGAYSMAAGVNYTCQPLVSPGSASASLTGTNTCNKMALSWSGFTGTIAGYRLYRSTDGSLGSLIKDIASTASSGSYTDSNVPANTYYYSIKAYNAGGESAAVAMAGNPKGIIDCQATASSEKDIVAVNSTPLPNWPYGYLSGGTDTLPAPIASSLKVGDTLSFSITLRSQGDMAVKNIRITDYLINLQMATSTGWNAKYNGAALIYDGAQPAGSTSCTPASSGHYCAFGTAPNQTLVFNLTGASYDIPAPVAPATEVDRSLTFDAQLAVPSGYGGSAPRFQNAYSASYDKTAGSQTTTTGSTPLILFSTGKKGPSIIEIP